MLFNVSDFATVQAALDAAHNGDRVYFPAGAYAPPSDSGWTITKRLEIFGDGIGSPANDSGTTLKPHSANGHVFVISVPMDYLYLHDFKIKRDAYAPGSGMGIRCVTGPSAKATEMRFERISVFNVGGDGFHFDAVNGNEGAIVNLTLLDCQAVACGGDGLYLHHVYGGFVMHCNFNACRGRGLYADGSGVTLYQSGFEYNGIRPSASAHYDASVRIRGCHVAMIQACQFERFNTDQQACKRALMLEDCAGAVVSGNDFINLAPGTGDVGITVDASGNGPVDILGNRFSNVDTLVSMAPSAVAGVVLPQYVVEGGAAMSLPASPNGGLFGVPTVNRLRDGPLQSGLIIPSLTSAPTHNLQDGMLYYDTQSRALKLRVDGSWRTVDTR